MIYKQSSADTPKIIEILNDSEHEFLTNCPLCGKKTLQLKLPTEKEIVKMDIDFDNYDVFYCDRCSSGIRFIMDSVRESQGLVIYEPNSARNISALVANASHADIVKFSSDRVPLSVANRIKDSCQSKLVISTLGRNGLSFSHKMENGNMSNWVYIPAETDCHVIDSSGAGDWLTAGFIAELFKQNQMQDLFFDELKIRELLLMGMKYSNLCCAAIGAQGVFYSKKSLQAFSQLSESAKATIVLGQEPLADKKSCPLCLADIVK